MRVLAVEGQEGLPESLRRGLSADGHAVEVAHDGHRGPDLAPAGGPYDLALLDVMLPGVRGCQICARMHAHGDTTPRHGLDGEEPVGREGALQDTPPSSASEGTTGRTSTSLMI
ncbi:response regulator [Streptomyces sp. NPDC002587]